MNATDRNIEALRRFQRIIRPLAEHDEYQRGLYNGIEMALAVLENGVLTSETPAICSHPLIEL